MDKFMKMMLVVMISIITISCDKSLKVTSLEKKIEGNWIYDYNNTPFSFKDGVRYSDFDFQDDGGKRYYHIKKDSILVTEEYFSNPDVIHADNRMGLEFPDENTMTWTRYGYPDNPLIFYRKE